MKDESETLKARYAEMGDGELLELRGDYGDLTETAQEVLRRELVARKLWSDRIGQLDPVMPPEALEERVSGDTLTAEEIQSGGETICECESSEQAKLVCYALERAGIRAVIHQPGGGYYTRNPQVRVVPADAERASALLAAGISDEVVRQFKAEPEPEEFVVPRCSACGSDEVLLESVEPLNQWLCGECGARWEDAPE